MDKPTTISETITTWTHYQKQRDPPKQIMLDHPVAHTCGWISQGKRINMKKNREKEKKKIHRNSLITCWEICYKLSRYAWYRLVVKNHGLWSGI